MVCIIEGCGIICVSIAYLTIVLANYSFYNIVVKSIYARGEDTKAMGILIVYEIIIFLSMWSHVMAMTS